MVQVCGPISENYRALVVYTLSELSVRWGIPVTFTDNPARCHLLYSSHPSADNDKKSLWIPFDPSLYQPKTQCQIYRVDGFHCWGPQRATDPGQIDLIGGIYRLLALLDETQVSESDRNSLGIFNAASLPLSRRSAINIPLVEEMAELLLLRLKKTFPELKLTPRPRWPMGKRWALVLTSDTDSIHLGDWRDILYNFGKWLLRRNKVYLEMVGAGIKSRGRLKDNPYFNFPRWSEWLEPWGVPITFFLFLQPRGVPRHLHDCRTSVDNQPVEWEMMKQLTRRNVEFGVHPSIFSKNETRAFQEARKWLEEKLQQPVKGLRHHYLALDWREPWKTLRKHQEAGFLYDSSLGYRDTPGFRAGTSLPYRPIDIESNEVLNMIELPMFAMDSQLALNNNYASSPPADIGEVIRGIEQIKKWGGVVVLNWHQEGFWNRGLTRGYFDWLTIILDRFLPDEECWLTTASQVAEHWLARYCLITD